MADSYQEFRRFLRNKVVSGIKWSIGCLYLLVGTPGYKSKIIVFVFHEVSDNPRAHARLTNTYSTKKNFLKQISLFATNFAIIDPQEDPSWRDTQGCLITFDDGYRGAFEAANVLEILNIASIHLVNLETIYGQPNSSAALHFESFESSSTATKWSDSNPAAIRKLLTKLSSKERYELESFSGPYMNPEELKELMTYSRVTVGDHFLNHWYGNSLNHDEIIDNLAKNSNRFSEIQEMKSYFASPHGRMSSEKVEFISEQGYEVIFSGSTWLRIGNTSILPRIDMNNSISSKASLFGAIAILIIRSKLKVKN